MEKTKNKLTGSMAAKVMAFFLLAISFITGTAGLAGCVASYEMGMGTRREVVSEFLWEAAMEDFDYLAYAFDYLMLHEDVVNEHFAGKNSSVEIFVEDKKVWSCYKKTENPYVLVYYGIVAGKLKRTADGYTLDREMEAEEADSLEYIIRLYVDENFPIGDAYRFRADIAGLFYDMRGAFPPMVIISVLICFLCFIFLMCGAGHKNGREGIVLSAISELPFDLVAVAFGFVAIVGMYLFLAFWADSFLWGVLAFMVLGMLETVWGTLFCVEFAARLKYGKFWRNTLIYRIWRGINHVIRYLFRGLAALIKGFPLVINAVIAFFAVGIVELFFCILVGANYIYLIWFAEKAVLLLLLIYFALVVKKLRQGTEALADGNLNYHLDTAGMLLDFKEQGENLNRIGEGISVAVEERMRSEHLKTELITNVSHDLKTPLTSIINYADLLGSTDLAPEKVTEYAEVLLRQSKRLKKLLEDLVEASKATTGNLEVNLVPCEVSVILSQAVGEYEQRFAQRGLELIIRQPEEAVRIAADGRHLWRTFDNLMNNIYKYAQENTRVYLTVEEKEASAEIIFRNMSKYALDVPGEELQERFVRGDKSRHMDGNGLGLSIAKSLVELQNGTMEIVTDGDLFKVIMRFPVLSA